MFVILPSCDAAPDVPGVGQIESGCLDNCGLLLSM
jgi:hypothetical protein